MSGAQSEAAHSRTKRVTTPTKKRSRKPPKPFSPNHDVFVHTISNNAKITAAVSTAGKCCSQCGATKTPQWREGPLGPKTLCNACGVKRVRAARAALEGRIRMSKSGSGGSASNSKKTIGEVSTRRSTKGKSTAARAAAFILAAIEEKEKEDDDNTPSSSAGGGRSVRTAASLYRRRPAAMAVDQEMTTSNSQSDDPEEIQFIPPKPPMSPISAVIGAHGVAALGLMSMTLPAEVVQSQITAQLEAHRRMSSNCGGGSKTQQEQPADNNTANTSESIETPFVKEDKGGGGDPSKENQSSADNNASNHFSPPPPPQVIPQANTAAGERENSNRSSQLEDLQNAAAEAAKHAYAADAAVAAVAQVLAIKQAVALKARAEAAAAAQRVHAVASLAMYEEKKEGGLGFLPPALPKSQ